MATVELLCLQCKRVFVTQYKHRNRKFCSRECVNKYQTGEGNPSFGKTYRTKKTHPEWALRTAESLRKLGRMIGDKNPMRNPDVAAKMSKTRRENVTSNPDYIKERSEFTRKLWAEGKYDGVGVGKCKWYEFTKRDNTTCKLQGTWELAYAKWLDANNISFIAHRGIIPYIDQKGNKRSYYPDFFLPNIGEYVDIKSDYHFSLNKEKWEWIRRSNPDLPLTLLFRADLKKMGVL